MIAARIKYHLGSVGQRGRRRLHRGDAQLAWTIASVSARSWLVKQSVDLNFKPPDNVCQLLDSLGLFLEPRNDVGHLGSSLFTLPLEVRGHHGDGTSPLVLPHQLVDVVEGAAELFTDAPLGISVTSIL